MGADQQTLGENKTGACKQQWWAGVSFLSLFWWSKESEPLVQRQRRAGRLNQQSASGCPSPLAQVAKASSTAISLC